MKSCKSGISILTYEGFILLLNLHLATVHIVNTYVFYFLFLFLLLFNKFHVHAHIRDVLHSES